MRQVMDGTYERVLEYLLHTNPELAADLETWTVAYVIDNSKKEISE